jgi:hypothetical protein
MKVITFLLQKVSSGAVAALVIGLSGCATHNWAPGPGMSASDFEPAKARCSLMARHSGGGFAAAGNANFVAGAALGNAIGESVRTQQDFNDCMSAGGWRIADQTPQTIAAQAANVSRVQSIKAQIAVLQETRRHCAATVRAESRYTAVISHFPDIATGKFSIAQLADDRLPTRAEGDVVTAYLDSANICRDTYLSEMTKFQPRVAAALKEGFDGQDANVVLLIKRKMSWGDWAAGSKAIGDATLAKLRLIQL